MSDESSKRVIGRPFQPGQSGNPSGRLFKTALLEARKAADDDIKILKSVPWSQKPGRVMSQRGQGHRLVIDSVMPKMSLSELRALINA
jgi:hypothetical protein